VLNEPLGLFDRILHRAKVVAEILAIFIGGWWVLSRFLVGDLPSLSPRIRVDSTLIWSPVVKDSCFAVYEVTLHNIGKIALELEDATLNVFLVDPPPLQGALQFVDPTEWPRTPLLKPRNLATDRYLGTSYAPDESVKAGTVVQVRRAPGRIVLVELTMRVVPRPQRRWISSIVGLLGGVGAPENIRRDWKEHLWEYACEQVDRDVGRPSPRKSTSPRSP
jgi:hypothetical protein